MPNTASKPRRRVRQLLLVGVLLVIGWLVFEYLTLPDVTKLAKENPKTTALMEVRAEEAREEGKKLRHHQIWVGLDAISKHAVDAVVLAEDASFYLHEGIDTVELRKAVEEALAKGSLGRGASTIPQQLVKNLYLSNERSLLRKAKEMVLARRLDDALTKRRILTLYLNLVEWGDGVWGIEAAAEEHFGVHARDLTAAQGAMLAAMLPNPRKRLPRLRLKGHYKYTVKILDRMHAARRLDAAETQAAKRDLAIWYGIGVPPETADDDDGEERD